MSKGYLYVVKADRMDMYKIGVSETADARMKTLQAGSPVRLDMVGAAYCEDAPAVERMIHDGFARQRSHNEWFKLDDKQMSRLRLFLSSVESHGVDFAAKMFKSREMILAGHSRSEVIRDVWGAISANGSRRFIKASTELDAMISHLMNTLYPDAEGVINGG